MIKEAKNILVVVAHQDDETIGCGATISKLTSMGKKVSVIYMTDGSSGYSKENQKNKIKNIRKDEAINACKCLGVKKQNIYFLNNKSQKLYNSQENMHNAIRLIRLIKPEIIFTHYKDDKHRDHKACYEIVKESTWKSFEAIHPELGDLHKTSMLVCFEITDMITNPNIYVDISNHINKKISALKSYKSQEDILNNYERYVYSLSVTRGFKINALHAECFLIDDVYEGAI